VIAHWAQRAKGVRHPFLKARYADLTWDLCKVVAGTRRDPEMARLAVDAYIASVSDAILAELYNRFEAALRALDLSCLINDKDRADRARNALMRLNRQAVSEKQGLWWLAFDRLAQNKSTGVTDDERQELVAGLEGLVLHFGDRSNSMTFNPHAAQDAAKRLIKHYTRLRKPDEVRRLHTIVAQAFEHFASLGDPMVASSVLQTAVNAYGYAGSVEDAKRVRILMEEKIGQSRDHMGSIGTEIKIPREDMDKFLESVVVDDLGSTFVRISAEFLPSRRELEQQLQRTAEIAPLMAHMPISIMADDHVAAKLGSVEDDPFGRLVHQATMNFGLSDIWLQVALQRAIEMHNLTPEHFVSWANRFRLFEDVTFLIEGVSAWYDGDFVKAVHVLVPQIECGLRSIVAKLGKPVTKPHSTVADVGVAIGMGDILYSEVFTEALGSDLTLFFLALYADPRGMNLRNRIAHGLTKPGLIDGRLVRLLIHTLLVFGLWKELAERRR
jgi:lysyl-tRNA synthetase class 1